MVNFWKRKTNRASDIYILSLLFALTFIACGTLNSSTDNNTTDSKQISKPVSNDTPTPLSTNTPTLLPEPTPTDTSSTGKIGSTLRVSGIVFRVDEVRKVDPKNLSSLYQRREGQIYLIIKVYMENVGLPEGLGIDAYESFSLTDSEGFDYGRALAPMTTAGVADEPDVYSDSNWKGRPPKIELGQTVEGVIGFEVREAATGFVLTYDSSIFVDEHLSDGPDFLIELQQ